MKTIATAILLCLAGAQIACGDSTEPRGTYSNRAEGFYLATFCARADGKGIYAAGLAAVPVRWMYDPDTQTITVTGNLGANLRVESRKLRFDPRSDVVWMDEKAGLPEEHSKLSKQSDIIHDAIERQLDSFDWNLERHELDRKASEPGAPL